MPNPLDRLQFPGENIVTAQAGEVRNNDPTQVLIKYRGRQKVRMMSISHSNMHIVSPCFIE
jgi:hypothetical protein